MNPLPQHIQLIEDELVIIWNNNEETYYSCEFLRKNSPSAENMGEKDIFGQQYGGNGPKNFPGVKIIKWDWVGNYAIRLYFSDGHHTGLYSYQYLKQLATLS